MTREGQLNCVELYTYISWHVGHFKKKIAPILYVREFHTKIVQAGTCPEIPSRLRV